MTTQPRITRTAGRVVDPPITEQRWREFLANRAAARNRGNWTDGGHWMGSGREPNAFDTVKAFNRSSMILTWPTDECVQKFRDQSKQIAERLGYGIAILTAIATRGRSWSQGLVGGLGTTWLLNRAGGIQVHRGWTYRSDNSLEVIVSAHPWGKTEMVVTRVQTLTNAQGVRQDHQSHTDRRDLGTLNDDMLFQLVTSLDNTEGGAYTISCPNASVLLPAA